MIASCTSLLQRLMTSAFCPARWMAPASTALATKPQTLDLPCMNGGGEPGGLGITPLQGGAGRQC